jgi:hypothetical protein
MNARTHAHPRAGLAIGAVLLAGWMGALGAAVASDESTGKDSRTGRAGPGYVQSAGQD